MDPLRFPAEAQLSPMFGGSKLLFSNDIVMPSSADISHSLSKDQVNLLKKN
jgi:hypothetical protein